MNELISALRRARASLILFVLVVLVTTLPAWASFEFSEPRWDSATEFLRVARQVLGRDRVVLNAQLDWSAVSARDAVLFLHPTDEIEVSEASAFVSAGGRLAVVDDFGTGEQLLSRFHIRRSLAPQPPAETYRDNPHLAIARPVSTTTGTATLKHPMVAQVDRVITNHPTTFARDPGVELTPVLTLKDAQGNDELFAVIGVIGDGHLCGLTDGKPKDARARCGRLFAMADASVFIDLMMQFEGNQALAKGLVEYLLEDDSWGTRGGKLYVVTNGFLQTGHFGGDDGFGRELERVLDKLHAMVEQTRREGLPKEWSWLLAILAALGTGIVAWQSSGKLYQRPRPRYAQAQPLSAQPGTAGRAAVLSAPTTHDALILLELKAGTEEYLKEQLRLPSSSSSSAVLAAVETQGALDQRGAAQLKELFQRFERAEKALLNSESLNIRKGSIKQVHRELSTLLPQVKPSPR